jgi:hypothetical protein
LSGHKRPHPSRKEHADFFPLPTFILGDYIINGYSATPSLLILPQQAGQMADQMPPEALAAFNEQVA